MKNRGEQSIRKEVKRERERDPEPKKRLSERERERELQEPVVS
jgi:hypothetical protein